MHVAEPIVLPCLFGSLARRSSGEEEGRRAEKLRVGIQQLPRPREVRRDDDVRGGGRRITSSSLGGVVRFFEGCDVSGCAFLLDRVGVLASIGRRGDAQHRVLDGRDVVTPPPDDDVNEGDDSRLFRDGGGRIVVDVDHVRGGIGCAVGELGLEERPLERFRRAQRPAAAAPRAPTARAAGRDEGGCEASCDRRGEDDGEDGCKRCGRRCRFEGRHGSGSRSFLGGRKIKIIIQPQFSEIRQLKLLLFLVRELAGHRRWRWPGAEGGD